jgi:1-aminocyclopropane-1-carboxylate deaminase/D-cysteine desulfhydrase-like pyridoxal-dependent ACC family enzyme
MEYFKTTPIQKIEDSFFDEQGVSVYVKRDDLTHPHIQGNKWRKLKYNLFEARLNGYNTLLTFGGPYSNHIYSTAAAAKLFHFKSIGIIRGEEPKVQSETLKFAASQGMELYYMDRAMYREKDKPESIESLRVQIGEFYYLPEGGTNSFAIEGAAEIVQEIDEEFDYICCPCGTGGTLAGIVTALNDTKTAIGFSSLKGEDSITTKVNELTLEYNGKEFSNFEINFDYHFGGYAKVNEEIVSFIHEFKRKYNIQLEPVYTGKMMYGIFDLISRGYFKPGSKIIAVHTGGLQGLNGYPQFFEPYIPKD